ncbi:MAG: HD domain-containing protein [Clostridia bacterium]|nr:HD domain-containing protein [Clostridia bacterium]
MFNEKELDALRDGIRVGMSEKRFRHTYEVEKMVVYLAGLYMPEKTDMLRAAALLHDVTKEFSTEEHIRILIERGVEVSEEDICSPKTLHARSAVALIPERYESFATDEVLSCVRWHTTGRSDMTLSEKLIYLADYIDLSRTFDDCVKLREAFMGAEPEKMSMEERLLHLDKILIMSFDMTMSGLLNDGLPISHYTVDARNSLICKKLLSR